jgi:hypothetical protein
MAQNLSSQIQKNITNLLKQREFLGWMFPMLKETGLLDTVLRLLPKKHSNLKLKEVHLYGRFSEENLQWGNFFHLIKKTLLSLL